MPLYPRRMPTFAVRCDMFARSTGRRTHGLTVRVSAADSEAARTKATEAMSDELFTARPKSVRAATK